MRGINWKKIGFEFLSIFIAVTSAFALNNWNDARKSTLAEAKILKEIALGLEEDENDIRVNMQGHELGISACQYFRKLVTSEEVNQLQFQLFYVSILRNHVMIQNRSGYENLKSRGLELIRDDKLRYDIISLYEYDYNTLRKFEEEYTEMQFFAQYHKDFNSILSPYLLFDKKGILTGLKTPLIINESEKNKLLTMLNSMEFNRKFILQYYKSTLHKIETLRADIEANLKAR